MKIQLKGRGIPRNAQGDPKFNHLSSAQYEIMRHYNVEPDNPPGILDIFTTDEVVELVNRAIYQLEYQHTAHKRRGQEQRDREKKIKEKVKQLYHVSWMKATPEQIQRATEEVGKETEG
jgi:hypothetical protein